MISFNLSMLKINLLNNKSFYLMKIINNIHKNKLNKWQMKENYQLSLLQKVEYKNLKINMQENWIYKRQKMNKILK